MRIELFAKERHWFEENNYFYVKYKFVDITHYKDDFLECWENRFQVMRDRSWAKTGECANCGSWRWCEGNGLHLRHEKTGELMMCQLLELKKSLT